MCLFSICVDFEQLLDIVYWKNRDLKYNSTVHKKTTNSNLFSTKKYNLHISIYLCFKNILPAQFSQPFSHSNSPEHTVFSSFSTHKLYNLQKITLTPYKVNQIEKTQKGIIININLVKLILFATYLIGFSGNKGSLKLFPYDISSVKLDILSVQHPKSK